MFWKKLFESQAKAKAPVAEEKKPQTATESSPLPKIHIAARAGDVETVRTLLQSDPGLISLVDSNGYIPLVWAVLSDKKNVAELLLFNKSELVSLLHVKSRGMADLLLAHQTDINPENEASWTALHSVAAGGCNEVVEALLARKADVNAANADGWTALHLAAYNNHLNVVKLLLAGRARVNVAGHDGQTPLHVALGNKGGAEIVELLLANGVEINARDKKGKTPLHLAVSGRKKDAVKLLLTHKADVNVRDKRGKTPLDLALIEEREDIAQLLRQHGGVEIKPAMIAEIALPPELIRAAESLEQRLRRANVPARKIPMAEWSQAPRPIHDLVPNWIPALLAKFSLHGAAFELPNDSGDDSPRYFSFWGPAEYARNLSGKNAYCFADEFVEEKLVMISDESDGNMWLTNISGGPSSPIYFFDLSAHEKQTAYDRIDLLMAAVSVSGD